MCVTSDKPEREEQIRTEWHGVSVICYDEFEPNNERRVHVVGAAEPIPREDEGVVE
jgi:hypothetical protein